MFSTAFVVATLAAFVAAAPTARDNNQCSTGTMHCCNSSTTANSALGSLITGLLGVVVGADAAVGLECAPFSILGGDSCTQQPVCCENNSFTGLVVIGCSPINLNL